jgi:uncharacterized protein YcfJ
MKGTTVNSIKLSALAAATAAALGHAGIASAAEFATVISATPVSGSVTVPRQECAEGQQVVQQPPTGAGALVGAIVGGVIGNQFGAGVGRAAATGLGVIAGSALGNQAEMNNSPVGTVPVRNCRTVGTVENRVVGYDVVYEYNGQRYSTRLASDPGPRLAIDVRPAGAVPPATYGAVPRAGYGAVPPATYGAVPPAYADPPPAYYAPAPAYYAPAPYYYPGYSPYYVAPAVVGLGIGLGYYGWRGGYGWGRGYGRWH